MARYIDLEELERRIKKYVKPEMPEEKAFVEYYKDECIRQGYAMPTADVVPKSEVEELSGKYEDLKLKYADLQKDKDELIAWVNDKKTDVSREIFEEIFEALQGEIDEEDKLGRNAWEIGDTAGYHIHQYAEEKLDTLQIALSLYKKKYTEGSNDQ